MADELKFDVIPNHNGDSGLGTTDTELLLQSKSPHDDEAVYSDHDFTNLSTLVGGQDGDAVTKCLLNSIF